MKCRPRRVAHMMAPFGSWLGVALPSSLTKTSLTKEMGQTVPSGCGRLLASQVLENLRGNPLTLLLIYELVREPMDIGRCQGEHSPISSSRTSNSAKPAVILTNETLRREAVSTESAGAGWETRSR